MSGHLRTDHRRTGDRAKDPPTTGEWRLPRGSHRNWNQFV